MDDALDNLVWKALAGPHRPLALAAGGACWYPADVAPFVAVAAADTRPDLDAAAAAGFCGPAYFVDVLPRALPDGWSFTDRGTIIQMVPGADLPAAADDDIRLLGPEDAPQMLELTRSVFPDFFRKRTRELGDYLGIFAGPMLIAMAGERLAVAGFREISGVCTHAAHRGRGHAQRLTRALLHRHRRCGVESFLHVSEGNLSARRLYGSMGFSARASLAIGKVERLPTA